MLPSLQTLDFPGGTAKMLGQLGSAGEQPDRTKGRAVVSKGFAALSLAQFPLFPKRTTFTGDPVATYA